MKLVPCPISEAELRTLYLETKLTDAEIAAQVGCPLKHIRRWRHRWGIETICRTERHEVPIIEGRLRSVLVGSMLGDGRISKGTHVAHYAENHAEGQKEYLEWKSKEWGSWVQLGLRPVTWIHQEEEYDGWRFETVGHATMLPWHALFYPEPGAKQLRPQVVDLVDSLALAIWFMDDGSRGWWPRITFGMRSGSREIARAIFQKFSLDPRWELKKDPTGDFIFEGEDQAHLFISLVKLHMPEFMHYKLNFGFQGPHYQVRERASEEILREMASQGVPIKKMAKLIGVGASTIDRHLKKFGIEHLRTVGRPKV